MPSTFLPRREAALDPWLANFAAQIAAAPDDFGLSLADAEEIALAVQDWHAAYLAAKTPSTRTAPAVIGKNDQKKIVLPLVRRFAGIIRANPDVSTYLKMSLGLHPPRPPGASPSPIPAPHDAPALGIMEMRVGAHTVRIARREASSGKVRPAGTAGLLLFRAIADAPVRNHDDARFLAFVTRSEYLSEFALGDASRGKTATYFARWTNFKGELGPWSSPASMQIAA